VSKLHELLAVDSSLKGQAEKTRTELKNTFEKKRHLFEEKKVTFKSFDEGKTPITEEQKDIQSTVNQELKWISDFLSNAINVSLQISEANTVAKASIVLDNGTEIAKDVPATHLLELEKKLKDIQDLVFAVPTLDPAKGFVEDPGRGKNIFKARDVSKTRTKKKNEVLILYPHTEQHPAQTKEIVVDVPVGEILEQEWSGLITPAAKADMLSRVEDLTRAVKKARSRANEVEVKSKPSLGQTLVNHIFGF